MTHDPEPPEDGGGAPAGDERTVLIAHLEQALADRQAAIVRLTRQLELAARGPGWAVLRKLWRVSELLRPGARARRATPDHRHSDPGAATALVPADRAEVERLLVARSRAALAGLQGDVRAIAFYLPQFHPIPENDRWWGTGFTEWTNVVTARPSFAGHEQPHLPADLGFYDLRVPEVREQQAELAREHGIHGFCYHHYWFNGRRLLERPFAEVLASGRPDFPFCVCWANEPWTRRWDGGDGQVLMRQRASENDSRRFIRSLLPAFRDPRYIRVGDRPLLLVYRLDMLHHPSRTAEIWREEVQAAGFPDAYLCLVQSFGVFDARPHGFDALVQFPPAQVPVGPLDGLVDRDPRFRGVVHDYLEMAEAMADMPAADSTVFPGVMPGWDNTARQPHTARVFVNSTPDAYEYWLGRAVERVLRDAPGDERLVFVNAWNEWGEGAHLEPDRRHGHAYLEATRRVMGAVGSAGIRARDHGGARGAGASRR